MKKASAQFMRLPRLWLIHDHNGCKSPLFLHGIQSEKKDFAFLIINGYILMVIQAKCTVNKTG